MSLSTSNFKPKQFFLYCIGLVIFLNLAHVVVGEICIRKLLKTENEMTQKKNAYYSSIETHAPCYILGTSHMQYIDIPGCFNFAKAFSYPDIMLYKLKHLIKHNRMPRLLLIEADTHLFYRFAVHADKSFYRSFLCEFSADKTQCDLSANKIRGVGPFHLLYSLRGDVAPIAYKVLLRNFISSFSRRKQKPIGRTRGNWYQLSTSNKKGRAEGRVKSFGIDKTARLEKEMVSAYRSLIRLAKQNHIRVILVRNPISSAYNKAINKQDFNQVKLFVSSFILSDHITVLDNVKVVSEDKYFYNQDHLNDLGLIKYSLYLSKYLSVKP